MKTLKVLLIPVLLSAAFAFMQPALAGEGPHGGDSAMRMFKGIELTDAQRKQIRSLVAASKAEKPETEAMKQLRESLQALVKADQFDASAARLLLEKQQGNMLEQQIERLKLQHQIRAVLTDEQKAKLDERQAKKRERKAELVCKED